MKCIYVILIWSKEVSEIFTSDKKQLKKAIDHAYIANRGGSDMYDAVYKVIKNYSAKVKGRKASFGLRCNSI